MRYAVRRLLGLSAVEWDALPWWEQDCYIEGLAEELNQEEGVSDYGG